MMSHLLKYFKWYSSDISTCKCTLCYMHWMTNTCCDDLGIDACNCKHISDLANQLNIRRACP